MEIIKEPNCIVECPCCGCQFKFDKDDIYNATGGMRHRVGALNSHKAVSCPICNKSIPIRGNRQKGEYKMIDINFEEIRNKLIDFSNYEPDPEYQKRLEEYHKKIEDDFQTEWSKKKFKWFFKKRRQQKLRAQISHRYAGPVFWLIEDMLDDLLPKAWENSEYFNKLVDVKDVALGDKNYFNYQIEELNRTLTYLNTLPPPVKYIKVKSKFYKQLTKMHPSISSSDVEGIRAKFTGIPIVIDDEIEDDYEPVYGEEN